MNAWTGHQGPVHVYDGIDSGLNLPVSLESKQTLIIAVSPRGPRNSNNPNIHAVRTPSTVIDSMLDKRRDRTVKPPGDEKILGEFNLTDWTLAAEHWDAPTDLHDVEMIARNSRILNLDRRPRESRRSGILQYLAQIPPYPSSLYRRFINPAPACNPDLHQGSQASIFRLPRGSREYRPTSRDWPERRPRDRPNDHSGIRDHGQNPHLLAAGQLLPDISENVLAEKVSITPYVNVQLSPSGGLGYRLGMS
ncbi:hypothetical protein N7539_006484 [Penicillium diatomitis]|uniref:Uncharacterized protein n=1 Tax=Penicillium diatomitis TaxID=2819901 RepID=A0A9X0BSW9_9EURO|nr:uncharacterized protein N7539_006484 [Penicillium diatomitis]KAJ5483038.1 hypothetical protein N7539_006484 [Penicillium diatomitis]